MKRIMMGAALLAAPLLATSANATIILPGTAGLLYAPFVTSTQGTLLASTTVSGTALTFATTMRSAVYLNTLGTIDFYYQVVRTGPGTIANQMIDAFTAADFSGYTVDAFSSAVDIDGTGQFTAANNPPSSTTTVGRSSTGTTMQTDFGTNGLMDNEISATYIFRTSATNYQTGTFGVIDGSTFSGIAFAPAAAVPEPATWGMMILGFGMMGASLRYRRRTSKVIYG